MDQPRVVTLLLILAVALGAALAFLAAVAVWALLDDARARRC